MVRNFWLFRPNESFNRKKRVISMLRQSAAPKPKSRKKFKTFFHGKSTMMQFSTDTSNCGMNTGKNSEFLSLEIKSWIKLFTAAFFIWSATCHQRVQIKRMICFTVWARAESEKVEFFLRSTKDIRFGTQKCGCIHRCFCWTHSGVKTSWVIVTWSEKLLKITQMRRAIKATVSHGNLRSPDVKSHQTVALK